MTTATPPADTPIPAPVQRPPLRTPWLLVGGVAIATAGVAAGLAWRPDAPAPVTDEPVRASMVSGESAVAPGRTTDQLAAEGKAADARPAPAKAPSSTARRAPAPTVASTGDAPQRAAVCATCGVVEGVRAVEKKGQGTGVGAVAGGVAGAAVGNQFGSGNGRAAMTVLGAIGGGVAGNEIEKRVRSETVYEVRVRMDDGSVRTLTQKTAPATGARVTVEGNTLRASSRGA
ncbi:MAG TPA: glycine zipper 2TM domain-containing protein [Albitalea sp.]